MKDYSTDYRPVRPRNSGRRSSPENRLTVIIIACLLAVLLISGVAVMIKNSQAKKQQNKNGDTKYETVSDAQTEKETQAVTEAGEGDTTAAADEPTTASAETTAPAATEPVSVEVTDFSATKYCNEELNVRSGPGTNYDIIGKFVKDDEVTVTGKCANGWLRVIYKEKAGYCSGSSKYLRDEKDASVPVAGKVTDGLPYLLKVNRTQNMVLVYGRDDNGEYTQPIKAMVCSVGLNGKTELGTFTIKAQQGKPEKSRWRQLTGGVYGQYITRFNGSILFHSVPYYSQNPADLEYNEYNKLGQAASAGCVRLCVQDAKWIYDNCATGTTVIVYDSSAAEPLAKPIPIKIDPNDSRRGWDPTDPDPNNPW